jgi:hypothetical protein
LATGWRHCKERWKRFYRRGASQFRTRLCICVGAAMPM